MMSSFHTNSDECQEDEDFFAVDIFIFFVNNKIIFTSM